jgi:hypothetical protein
VYKSKQKWTPSLLKREREAFFDTRVSGRAEVWSCIKMATELLRQGDLETAQSIVDAADVTVPTGDMVEGVYDQAGGYYQLPNWVVADPSNIREDNEEDLRKVATTETAPQESSEADIKVVDKEESKKEEKGKGKLLGKDESTIKIKARLSDRATDVIIWVGKDETVHAIIGRIREEAGVSLWEGFILFTLLTFCR